MKIKNQKEDGECEKEKEKCDTNQGRGIEKENVERMNRAVELFVINESRRGKKK